jgi:hypothetical protein
MYHVLYNLVDDHWYIPMVIFLCVGLPLAFFGNYLFALVQIVTGLITSILILTLSLGLINFAAPSLTYSAVMEYIIIFFVLVLSIFLTYLLYKFKRLNGGIMAGYTGFTLGNFIIITCYIN